jgi:ferredoxin
MTLHVRVDPIACTGHGLCAELFPELIELDDWGYPIIGNGGVVPAELEDYAQRAADACPTLALLLERKTRHHAAPRTRRAGKRE